MIMLLLVPVWICVTIMAQFLPEHPLTGLARNELLAIVFIPTIPIIALLAGALSLGEERTLGTHAWHMTLPISPGLQWLIKLVIALSASLVCAALVPMFVLNMGGMHPKQHDEMVSVVQVWSIGVLFYCLASFWCACMSNGTVRAIVRLFVVMFALSLVVQCGGWVAQELEHEVSSVSNTLLDIMASSFDTSIKFTNVVSNLVTFDRGSISPMVVIMLWCTPLVLFVVFQSYRLFRAQLQESGLSVLRTLLPVAAVAFLSAFSMVASLFFVAQAKQQMWAMFRETHEAIEKIQPGMAKLDAEHPLQLTGEDLSKASSLSDQTRRWLRNSNISVVPDFSNTSTTFNRFCCTNNIHSYNQYPAKVNQSYIATIHLANGSVCTLSLRLFPGRRGLFSHGILGGKCE